MIRSWLFVFLLAICSANLQAQKQVAIISFYLDREVDFSLMQMFDDDSEKKIKKLMEDPEFNLDNTIEDFHQFITTDILPKAPFQILDESLVTGSSSYQSLNALVDAEKSRLHEPAKTYLKLGNDFKDQFLPVAGEVNANGVMMVELKFFVRKNVLKTVIMAQVEINVRNTEGKQAYRYQEFGLSKEGINTFSGFVISKQDEVLPMFNEAIDDLKVKMSTNFEKRAQSAAKKL
ncbi:MAG: hypothetical protein RIB47_06770 [Cyclobacteriaceae bacterium]